MLEQYRRIKRDHRGEVLFFRLGDFYEMFAEDALEVSALLNLTLTTRAGLPMCGVPYHAARSYIARLLRYGKKVAICEQMSEAGKSKLIERQVVEMITPGTTVDEDFLDKGSSNYLASLAAAGRFFSFSYIDLSTGEFFTTSFPPEDGEERLALELERLPIMELIVSESVLEDYPGIARLLSERQGLLLDRWADWLFDLSRGRERLLRQFGTANLEGFGLSSGAPEIISAGALLEYLDDTAKTLIPHVRTVTVYGQQEFMEIDDASQRNLELIRNLRDGTGQFTLFETADETKTSMGKRLLKRRLLHPLRDRERIRARLDMVEVFYRDQGRLVEIREILGRTPDLERLCSRLAMDKAHGKDLLSIKNAIVSCLAAAAGMPGFSSVRFESAEAASLAQEDFAALDRIRLELERGLVENPSILLSEGNLIREGYSGELDELRKLKESGRRLLEEYLEEERQAAGMPGLKIHYNRLIGYFFEVSKVNLSRVPEYFIRRQGMAGGERFTTDRLVKLESDINGASDRIIELEKKLFLELREQTKGALVRLAAAAKWCAELDAAQSLARAATIRNWRRPEVNEGNEFAIIEGRHPVVEAHLPSGEFIPNDLLLDASGISFALITGPNMAGKSTYLRQAALIAIMAQMGSFVPASEARIGITDRIYCRVGASDNLARGESTFLVEMNETARILHTATKNSFVIMDEVGRGTGTSDGLAIAWAVCEDILSRICCRTLFATHYHELALLSHPRMANRSMAVLDRNGEIVFLRKLVEGPAAESYGIHVAGLAGIPEAVLDRARTILERIREKDTAIQEVLTGSENPAVKENKSPVQTVSLREAFSPAAAGLIRELSSADPDNMTPLEALKKIQRWKNMLEQSRKGTPEKFLLWEKSPTRKEGSRGGKSTNTLEPGLFN